MMNVVFVFFSNLAFLLAVADNNGHFLLTVDVL